MIPVREGQSLKADHSRVVRFAGRATSARAVQPSKAHSPMEVRLSGRASSVREAHS